AIRRLGVGPALRGIISWPSSARPPNRSRTAFAIEAAKTRDRPSDSACNCLIDPRMFAACLQLNRPGGNKRTYGHYCFLSIHRGPLPLAIKLVAFGKLALIQVGKGSGI